MTTINATSFSVPKHLYPSSSTANAGTADAIPSLPEARDPLMAMINGGDIGAAVAALVMTTEKEIRKSARAQRDAEYSSLETAQKQELDHMKASANIKLASGIVEGTLKLGSAAASFGAAGTNFSAAQGRSEIERLTSLQTHAPLSIGDTAKLDGLSARSAELTHTAAQLDASGKASEALGGISSSVGDFFSKSEDRDAKTAENRGTTQKRLAEGHDDDVRDADESIDKAMEFYQQWLTGKAAAESAALHRA